MRLKVDGQRRLLSSGTEDYFLSSFYFDAGTFTSDVAGVLQWKRDGGRYGFTGYRFHEDELILFKESLQLTWRNGERNDTRGLKCMDDMELDAKGRPIGSLDGRTGPSKTLVNAHFWLYTW